MNTECMAYDHLGAGKIILFWELKTLWGVGDQRPEYDMGAAPSRSSLI